MQIPQMVFLVFFRNVNGILWSKYCSGQQQMDFKYSTCVVQLTRNAAMKHIHLVAAEITLHVLRDNKWQMSDVFACTFSYALYKMIDNTSIVTIRSFVCLNVQASCLCRRDVFWGYNQGGSFCKFSHMFLLFTVKMCFLVR